MIVYPWLFLLLIGLLDCCVGVAWIGFCLGCWDCFGFAGFVVYIACDLGVYVVRFACVVCVVFDVVCVVWFAVRLIVLVK